MHENEALAPGRRIGRPAAAVADGPRACKLCRRRIVLPPPVAASRGFNRNIKARVAHRFAGLGSSLAPTVNPGLKRRGRGLPIPGQLGAGFLDPAAKFACIKASSGEPSAGQRGTRREARFEGVRQPRRPRPPQGVGGGHHSTTRSARMRTLDGIVRPMARAVFKLTTSSKRVACSTGMSAGRVPLMMRSTSRAAWRPSSYRFAA